MIRKMLVAAAAVAMPATFLAAASGAGVAGATKAPVQSTTCGLSGSLTFAPGGLTVAGTASKHTTSKSQSHIQPTSGACGASSDGLSGYASIVSKIVATNGVCATDASPAPACSTAGNGYNYFYGTPSFLTSHGADNIASSLHAKPVKAYNTGNKVTLNVSATAVADGDVARIAPNGFCGTNLGFKISGTTSVAGLTYVMHLCLVGDSGTGTSGTFLADAAPMLVGANTGVVITGATFAGASDLEFTKA
jgi:hypothetical protein